MIDKTDLNRLYIITIVGGTIGWSNKCDVSLRVTDSVAEEHAHIKFIDKKDDQHYEIECLQKKYQIYLNGETVSVCSFISLKKIDFELQKKQSARLEHGSTISIGPYRLEIHIHKGLNTCTSCEPGLLNANLYENQSLQPTMTRNEIRRQHRKELQAIKKHFGLDEAPTCSDNYYDRASKRRKQEGSVPNYPNKSDIYSGCKAVPMPGMLF